MKLFALLSLPLIAVALTSAVPALAQTAADDERLFRQSDTTEDGWLSGTELQGGWLRYDSDGDREVTRAEFLAGRARERGARPTKPTPAAPAVVAPALPPVKRTPGFIVGRCVTAQNRPLAGVRLRVFGVSDAGENISFQARTNAAGAYAVKLPPGSFHLGWALYDAPAPAGPPYALPLYPVDGEIDDAPSGPGIVENCVLKLSGRISPLMDPNRDLSYFGGSILVSGGGIEGAGLFDDKYYRFPIGSSVELTLVPVGNLPDGSPGRTLVLRQAATKLNFLDIPIGQYRVTARLLADGGEAKPLRVAVARFGTGTSPIHFSPTAADYGPSGTVYFSAAGDGTPLLKTSGVGYAEISVLP
jgi:hypothetical protein